MTTKIVHAICGQEVEKDEYGITTEGHINNECRNSATHITTDKPKSTWKLGRTGAGGR